MMLSSVLVTVVTVAVLMMAIHLKVKHIKNVCITRILFHYYQKFSLTIIFFVRIEQIRSRHKNRSILVLKFFNKKCKEPHVQLSNTNSCALQRSLKFSSPLSGAKVSSVEQDTIEFEFVYLHCK